MQWLPCWAGFCFQKLSEFTGASEHWINLPWSHPLEYSSLAVASSSERCWHCHRRVAVSIPSIPLGQKCPLGQSLGNEWSALFSFCLAQQFTWSAIAKVIQWQEPPLSSATHFTHLPNSGAQTSALLIAVHGQIGRIALFFKPQQETVSVPRNISRLSLRCMLKDSWCQVGL